MRLQTLKEDLNCELVTAFGLERDCSVLGVAGLWTVPTEDGHVGGGDAQQAALRHGLHCGVKEGGRTAVGVEVDHIEPVLLLFMLVHQQSSVTIVTTDEVTHLIVLHISLYALHGLPGPVVGHDTLHPGQLLGKPDGPQPAGCESLQYCDPSISVTYLLCPLVNEILYDGRGEVPVELLDRVVEHIVEAGEQNLR